MADDVEVKLYLDHVQVVVKEATEKVLKQLAYRIVEGTQLQIRDNDQIDTGFMVNSVYAIWAGGSGYSAAVAKAYNFRSKRKDITAQEQADASARRDVSSRKMIEEALPDDSSAGVVVGASYAIYQEAAKPFLYPAAERAANEFGGEAERIYKENLPDEGPKA